MVFVSSPARAPRWLVIIGKMSEMGTGMPSIARTRACFWPLSLIWHYCKLKKRDIPRSDGREPYSVTQSC
jgi:hypothetical protein